MENNEDNEVISVRLLNRYSSIPYSSKSTEVQTISYENVEESIYPYTSNSLNNEDETDSTTLQNSSSNPIFPILEITNNATTTSTTTTTATTTTTSTTSRPITQNSYEYDWSSSRIEIPDSVEASVENWSIPIEELPLPTSTHLPSSSAMVITTTSTEPTIAPQAKIIGERKRVARMYDEYQKPPEMDLRRMNFGNLNGFRFKDLFPQGSIPESMEQPNSKHYARPHSGASSGCPCAKRHQESYDYTEDGDDYFDNQQPPNVQFPRIKRLLAGKSSTLEDELPETDLSIERAERMQGALERIMGIVTIISHVDNFIQKKTKQSIKRLARLYDSSEE
ncbi:uncharacterized protein LOC131430293 isoform X2 [Malaya genurostris]|nr:uncharacterized protein LOC131430293 isoform X2 [Malaya genurostris]